MGVYKRGDTWGISYFHNGKRIRKNIGTNKKKAEAELEAIRVAIRGAWETAKTKASIPEGFRFHDLRHTFASHQKMAGTDDFTLMELLGHSDFTMMKRYAHLSPEHKREAIGRLPEWKAKKDSQKSVRNSDTEEKRATG